MSKTQSHKRAQSKAAGKKNRSPFISKWRLDAVTKSGTRAEIEEW